MNCGTTKQEEHGKVIKYADIWRNILHPSSMWLNPVKVDGEVIGRKECVSYPGSSDGILPIFHTANDQIPSEFPT